MRQKHVGHESRRTLFWRSHVVSWRWCTIHQRIMQLYAARRRLLVRSLRHATSTTTMTTTMSFSPAGSRPLFILSGWRAYSSARRGSKSSPDSRLYRVGGGCCEEAKFAFPRRVSTPICSALERRVSGRKKRPASDAIFPFFSLFLFTEREETRVCISWPVLRVGRLNNTV